MRLFTRSLIIISIAALASGTAEAQERRVVVEDIPQYEDFYRVSAAKTHSGLPVPRFVSLKFGRVNGRQGPSLKHPVLWQYRRKGLPLIVIAEMDVWRKVRDVHGDESWVRGSSLSGTRMALTRQETTLRAKPKTTARIKAVSDANVLLEVDMCNEDNWCKVSSGDGYKGWALKSNLWGAGKL